MNTKSKVQSSPADPTLPKVALTLNGREYFLAFDFNALAVGSELLGENLLEELKFENISARRLRVMLFVGLLKFQPEITEEEAGALGGPFNAGKILNAIAAAYTGSNPEASPETGDSKVPNA
jgi:hypothetical protein